jgi:hypothetical protein
MWSGPRVGGSSHPEDSPGPPKGARHPGWAIRQGALKRATSRANGTKFGRVDDTEHINTAKRMQADGHTSKAIAKYLGVTPTVLPDRMNGRRFATAASHHS